ncbi:hypothetical protein BYT27DRAFT_7202008, partial [Phlegmacium glaucopus]
MVQEFIKERSKAKNVKEQLHAIWYCIPTSDDRPITAAEKKFFNECGTGLEKIEEEEKYDWEYSLREYYQVQIPVIVLWTKTDSLDVAKIKELMKEGRSRSEAMQEAPQKAWVDYESNIYPLFDRFKYPPKAYVVFRKMHEPGADCRDLIEKTTAALSTEELQQLFLSTQQNNVEVCIKYGVKRLLNQVESTLLRYFKKSEGNWAYFMATVLRYFPQIVDSISKIMSPILSNLSAKFNLKEATYCAIVAAIIGHLSFFLHQESPSTKNSLERAAQIYQHSTSDASVKQAIEKIFELENLFKGSHVTTPVKHTFSNPFKGLLHVDDVNHEVLVGEAVQTALNNLL